METGGEKKKGGGEGKMAAGEEGEVAMYLESLSCK